MSHDSDMAEMGRAMQEHRRNRHQERMIAFEAWQADLVALGLKQKADYHWTIEIDGQVCQYWPSADKWQYGRIFHGDVQAFHKWLRRRVGMSKHFVEGLK